MIRTSAVIILILCFSLQNISKLIIVLNYHVNKDYISKNLCVNRDEPDSCCHGKCELKKELDEDDKRQNEPANNNNTKDKYEKEQYCQALISNLLSAGDKADLIITLQKFTPKQFNNSVFHPPPAA
jgi:hypothetical protein